MILIINGEVYAPEYIGKKSILLAGGKIEGVYDNLEVPKEFVDIQIIDAMGKLIFPGFIDSHVHIIGGGGEGGFNTRTPEIELSDLISGGITTVVGCIGTDGICRDMKSLLAKAYSLEEEGITTYIYTGSYQIPVKSIMDSPDKDITLIGKIIGIGEIALSDHRSSQPTFDQFVSVVAKARVAGLITGKAGIVNVHIGNGRKKLDYLIRMVQETDLPIRQVIPTHINRNRSLLNEGAEFAKMGGIVDLTTSCDPHHPEDDEVRASVGLRLLLENGVEISSIQFTSDAQGSLPIFDKQEHFVGLGIGTVSTLYREVRDAVINEKVSLENALKVITENVANNLRLKGKGRIEAKKDADLIMVDKDSLNICDVISKGIVMMKNGEIKVKGTFEKK